MVPFWCTSRDQHVVNDFSTSQIRNSISLAGELAMLALKTCSSPEFVKPMLLTYPHSTGSSGSAKMGFCYDVGFRS